MPRQHRFDRTHALSVQNWKHPKGQTSKDLKSDVALDCGWGRLIFAHTYRDNQSLAEALLDEKRGKRDIAIYLRDPHVVISLAPQHVFLDPSHTYRLWLDRYQPGHTPPKGFVVRKMLSLQDAEAINCIYAKRQMVTVDPDFLWKHRESRRISYLVAEDIATGEIIGTVTGVDHRAAFHDPENGTSLWCLAVDPQAAQPGVGEALVRHVAEHFMARGRAFLDLSVMHDNAQAIRLYDKLGFTRVPVFTLKNKNSFNEPLFVASPVDENLNPYAAIIAKEAARRGIAVDILDEQANYISLSFGGRAIVCRESLSELTSAVAMSRCDDKRVTTRLLREAGLRVADQINTRDEDTQREFLTRHGSVVVKPARGEQGAGISVDVRSESELKAALQHAHEICDDVLIEEYISGKDLRVIVINDEVVAAAVRRPASITGTGQHSIAKLIEKQSRRRAAATGGESRIPLDGETLRCVETAGYTLDSILPAGKILTVRKTANLHTGGTIHDVTELLHPTLADAALRAARAIDIPVVGLDFLVPHVDGEEYVIIEANERPGLANHEPQPTAQRFIDMLFPQTVER